MGGGQSGTLTLFRNRLLTGQHLANSRGGQLKKTPCTSRSIKQCICVQGKILIKSRIKDQTRQWRHPCASCKIKGKCFRGRELKYNSCRVAQTAEEVSSLLQINLRKICQAPFHFPPLLSFNTFTLPICLEAWIPNSRLKMWTSGEPHEMGGMCISGYSHGDNRSETVK